LLVYNICTLVKDEEKVNKIGLTVHVHGGPIHTVEPPAVSATPPAVTLMEELDCMPQSPGMQKVGRNKKILSTIRMETYLPTDLIN
jgi:hypothetical protein